MTSLFGFETSFNSTWKPIAAAVFFAAFFPFEAAHARALGEVGLHLATERTEDAAGTATSDRRFRLNLAMGWLSELNQDEVEESKQTLGYGLVVRTERGFQTSSELNGFGLGVFLGYYAGPLSVRVDYFALSELKSNNGIVETAFREGMGYAINVRWLHWFAALGDENRRIGVGPSLSFEQTTYTKSRVGSLPETSASRTIEALSPGLAALFYF